jgi:lipid A 3-O-deacylase
VYIADSAPEDRFPPGTTSLDAVLWGKRQVGAVGRVELRLMWTVFGAAAALVFARPLPAMADPPDTPILGISELKFGALYHDPPYLWSNFSVERQTADANFEVLFVPWARTFGGYLRPAIGTSVNFVGGTSKAYADLRWEMEAPSGVFFALGMGAAIHDGELGIVDADHKALGSRVLFHPSAEFGYRFDGVNSISIFADHVSNGFTQRYNEGLDTIGIRYGRRLAPIAPEAIDWAPDSPIAIFAGFYVGAFAGYQVETVDWFAPSPVRSTRSDFAYGGYAGYSWQSGKGIFGIEVDASPAPRSFAAGCDLAGISCQTEVRGVYSARARFGWVINNSMLYGTAGVALTPWDAGVVNLATSQRLDQATGVNAGVAVGTGLEYKLGTSLGVRGEVMHYGMYGWSLDLPAAGPTSNQFQSTVGRVGISWYFH